MSDTRYKPYDDLRLYPGIHLSEERKRRLDADELDPDELSPEDIVYKLGRMVTGTMYSLLEIVEERWGKEGGAADGHRLGTQARPRESGGLDEVAWAHQPDA